MRRKSIVGLITMVFSFCLVTCNGMRSPQWLHSSNYFNIVNYGAVGNGIKDNSNAFFRAWNDVCNSQQENPTLIIPPGRRFLLNPINFQGPCRARRITVTILGEILAPMSPEKWKGLDNGKWVSFIGVNGLNVIGPGVINGNGRRWWLKSCRDHPYMRGCTKLRPTALGFYLCNDLNIKGITSINPGQMHLAIYNCNRVIIDAVQMIAPELSPNTDGIHIQLSRYVTVTNANIATGDDCISIGERTSNVKISDIKCGPGHGISIGSLGRDGNYVRVENIHVSRIHFTKTTNGARIKTWKAGKGYVRGVTFENVNVNSAQNPIIIDQNYCLPNLPCEKKKQSGIHISDVAFNNFYGISSSQVSVTLNCSKAVACTAVTLRSIKLISEDKGQPTTSMCTNAHGTAIGPVPAGSCLLQ